MSVYMNGKVLIISRSMKHITEVKQILNRHYKVVDAASSGRVIKLLYGDEVSPDVILIDTMAACDDTHEIIKIIRSQPITGYIPVIILTKTRPPENHTRTLKEGIAGALSFPLDPQTVLTLIENSVNAARYRSELDVMMNYQKEDLIRSHEQMLMSMANVIEHRSLESGIHVRRTVELARILVCHLLTKPEFCEKLVALNFDKIIKAVALHDIGKIGIPDRILLKQDKLTDEEFEVMKTHTTIGSSIIENFSSVSLGDREYLERCKELCRWHHEQWDGKGYPDGLSGEEIPLSARILSVVDVYEALTAKRCYKQELLHKQAVEILKEGMGVKFCPDVFKAFLEIHSDFGQV